MTDVIARVILPFYLRYEHKIDTRSELVRDWAVHGPLGAIAAELMGVERVRLYNAELIFHRGATSPTCEPAWHRDTLAAPFEPHNKAVTFNVYLEPIDAEGDGLVYFRGSHLRLDAPPASMDLLEPAVRVGSILAHDPNAYHTTSGRGCWRRRSLQFRYVADGATFSFGPHRLPHGPIPWTFAHAPGVAPHGLSGGEPLAGPWYPLVHPEPLASEHAPAPGPAWSPGGLFKAAKEADENFRAALNGTAPAEPLYGFDGPVTDPSAWAFMEMAPGVSFPFHTGGEGYKKAAAKAAASS